MPTYNEDYHFGTQSELEVLELIRFEFNPSIVKTAGRYDTHDFKDNEGTLYELRSRRVSVNAYPSTIVMCHKYEVAEELGKPLIFLFRFTDGLYYIRYDKEKFSNYEIKDIKCGYERKDGYGRIKKDKPQAHVLIPIEDLTEICC